MEYASSGPDLLAKAEELIRAVLPDVVLLVVHTDDTPIHGEQWPRQTIGNYPVKVLSLVFRHLKYDFCWVVYSMVLETNYKHNIFNKFLHIKYYILHVAYYISYKPPFHKFLSCRLNQTLPCVTNKQGVMVSSLRLACIN